MSYPVVIHVFHDDPRKPNNEGLECAMCGATWEAVPVGDAWTHVDNVAEYAALAVKGQFAWCNPTHHYAITAEIHFS